LECVGVAVEGGGGVDGREEGVMFNTQSLTVSMP
jgi:hypothetical protein